MRFDREDYSHARTLASFEYMGEQFRVVRRRYDGKPWRKQLMVLHGNAAISNMGYAWQDVTDPAECARLCLAFMQERLTERKLLDDGLAFIHDADAALEWENDINLKNTYKRACAALERCKP